jgi:hypothetical protein
MSGVAPETLAMVRSLVSQAKETRTTNAEIIGCVMAELLKTVVPESIPENKEQAQAPSRHHDTNTGPAPQDWVAPVNGFYQFDGRFRKNSSWQPTPKPVIEDTPPSVPDVLTAIQGGAPITSNKRMVPVTLSNGTTKLYEDTPEFRAQRAKEQAGDKGETVVFVPAAKPDKLVMQEQPSKNTYSAHRSHFLIEGGK